MEHERVVRRGVVGRVLTGHGTPERVAAAGPDADRRVTLAHAVGTVRREDGEVEWHLRDDDEPDAVGRGDDVRGGGSVALVSDPRAGVLDEPDGRIGHRSVADRGAERRPLDGDVRVRLDRRHRVRVRSMPGGEVRGPAGDDEREKQDDHTSGDREPPALGQSASDPFADSPHGVGAAF